MKRKIKHIAVNNQEDEDSCAYPICLPGEVPVEKKEDIAVEASSAQLFSDGSGNNEEPTSKGE
jgi:hypothetical protein